MDTTRAGDGRRFGRRGRELLLGLLILLGLAGVCALSRWLEARRPPAADLAAAEEALYVTPEAAKRLSLGFDGLVADWYWMRALQYVGRKALAHHGALQLDDLSPLGLRQLAPLLERATTLDPQFIPAYEYGAVVLPSVDDGAAIRLLEKGIRANPRAWRLWHHLGYIYWQQGRFREASESYGAGARVAGAPAWMRAMAAQMAVNGDSREVARSIYRRLYTEADDEHVKQLALRRYLQVESLDERDVIRRVLAEHRGAAGRCAASWRELAAALKRAGAPLRFDRASAPLDPTGLPYVLDAARCDVGLDPRSEIPQK